MSKVVMVNSSHIRKYAEQFNTNIWQVPSIVDTEKFRFVPFEQNGRPCVGWSGSPTTLINIKMLEKPLQSISETGLCDIHFIGGTDFGINGIEYTAQNGTKQQRTISKDADRTGPVTGQALESLQIHNENSSVYGLRHSSGRHTDGLKS